MIIAEEEAEKNGITLEVLLHALTSFKELERAGHGDLGTQALMKHYENT